MTILPLFKKSVSNSIKGDGKVFIASRRDESSSGVFTVSLSVRYNPLTDRAPEGGISIRADLSDSLKAAYIATGIGILFANRQHSSVIYLTGTCMAICDHAPSGLRYWVRLAYQHQKMTPDEVGFVVHDSKGNRLAYGMGPLISGIISVTPPVGMIKPEMNVHRNVARR
jgi:hypothetical protein